MTTPDNARPLYGVSTLTVQGEDLAAVSAPIAAAGFRDVELYCRPYAMPGWLADVGAAARAFRNAGLTVRSVHAPRTGWNNSSPDDEARRASAVAAASCLELAAAAGAATVIWHPTGPGNTFLPENAAEHVARVKDSLAEFAGRARAFGLRVAVENLPRQGEPRPLCSVEELLPVVAAMPDDVGICLDTGHSNANGYSAAAEARLAGRRLFAMHIHDNDGQGRDQHLPPGEGTADWPDFLRALEEIGARCCRVFEVDAGGLDPAVRLMALAETARRWSG